MVSDLTNCVVIYSYNVHQQRRRQQRARRRVQERKLERARLRDDAGQPGRRLRDVRNQSKIADLRRCLKIVAKETDRRSMRSDCHSTRGHKTSPPQPSRNRKLCARAVERHSCRVPVLLHALFFQSSLFSLLSSLSPTTSPSSFEASSKLPTRSETSSSSSSSSSLPLSLPPAFSSSSSPTAAAAELVTFEASFFRCVRDSGPSWFRMPGSNSVICLLSAWPVTAKVLAAREACTLGLLK